MTSKLFYQTYKTSQFKIEGYQIKEIPLQHAHVDIYKNWGKFTSSFTIVRNPLDRFISEIDYYFKLICHKNNQFITTKKGAILFANEFSRNVLRNYFFDRSVRENHIRPQSDFITEETKILFFEKDWISQLAIEYELKGKPLHINRSQKRFKFSDLITQELKKSIVNFYINDYKNYHYDMNF